MDCRMIGLRGTFLLVLFGAATGALGGPVQRVNFPETRSRFLLPLPVRFDGESAPTNRAPMQNLTFTLTPFEANGDLPPLLTSTPLVVPAPATIPLPSAFWSGATVLGGLGAARTARRIGFRTRRIRLD